MNKSLIVELYRIRSIMELNNTEIKVRFRQGIDFRDITTLPENSQIETFTGNEIGTIIDDPQLTGGEVKAMLDDGRIVLTADNAVESVDNNLDVISKETNYDNSGTNDGGTAFF